MTADSAPTPATFGWIGVDLDGTLAHYDHWRGDFHIGSPIPTMVARIKGWLSAGLDVRVFTARANDGPEAISLIEDWCYKHLGCTLPVTATKDRMMIELWDDRAIQVVPNSGLRADGKD